MTARRAALSLFVALGLGTACAHTHFEMNGMRYAIDRAACCAVPEGTDYVAEGDACRARGCQWEQALLCMGVDFPDEEARAEHRGRVERCERRCECVCPADREACSNVP